MKRERLLFFYYFIVGVYTAILFGLGFAVFNVKVGAEYLPVIFVIFPFLDAVTAFIMVKVITKKGMRLFFRAFLGVVAILHLALIPLLFQSVPSVVGYGFMLVVLIALSENLLFTRTYLIQDVFSLEELQSWVPVATSFGALGALTGGLVLRASEGVLAPGYIFIYIFPLLLIVTYCTSQMLATSSKKKQDIFSERMVTVKSIWSYTTSQSFLPLLMICIVLVAMTDTVNEFLFHFHSTKALGSIEQLTGFLGVFLGVRYFTELILNIFVYGRLVKKVGSINLLPVIMIVAGISLFIMNFAQQTLVFVLLSRVLSVVAVVGFMVYLLEVFYQLLDPLYRPALVTVIGYIDAFSGYALGGLLLMSHTLLGVPVRIITAVLLFGLLILSVVWTVNKKSFIDVLNTSQSAELSESASHLIGTGGSKNMVKSLLKRAMEGSRSERLFLLNAIMELNSEEQIEYLTMLFDISEMEIRVDILEYVFSRQLFHFNPELHAHELNNEFKNWLIGKCFVNYPAMKGLPLYERLKALLIETEAEDEAIRHMMWYMFTEDHSCYIEVLRSIKNRKQLEGDALIRDIIISYKEVEEDAHIEWFLSGEISTPEVMCLYDHKIGYQALRKYVKTVNYETMISVIKNYDYNILIEHLDKPISTFIQKLYLAEVERYSQNTYRLYNTLFDGLVFVQKQLNEVDMKHKSARFLVYELTQLKVCIETLLVDQILEWSNVSLAGKSYNYLKSQSKRGILIEMLRGLRASERIQDLISVLEGHTDKFTVKNQIWIGDHNNLIMTLIHYNRGEPMNSNRQKELDFMIALKSVPMFETLNVETLKKLSEIATVSKINSGDTIVRKGHKGKEFFVLLKGQAVVYLNEKERPIAQIPEGEMIGELAVINDGTRTATVKADGPVQLLTMEGDAFLELIQKNTAIGMAVIKTLSFRLADMLRAREISS